MEAGSVHAIADNIFKKPDGTVSFTPSLLSLDDIVSKPYVSLDLPAGTGSTLRSSDISFTKQFM